MGKLLVTGSIGIDTVITPTGRADEVLGGSAVYFAMAASLFGPVRLVGVVGEDFPDQFRTVFDGREVDLAGLEVRKGSKTFRWTGEYAADMNDRQTLNVELNVLDERGPTIPESFHDSQYVFLANTHPVLQRDLLAQVSKPKLAVCDTMDLWIETEREELLKTLAAVHGVVLNDSEALLLTGQRDLVRAGRWVLEHGPNFVVIKKGQHGCVLVAGEQIFVLPAYPTIDVLDPTGAGDAFAGGMMGYLASVDLFSPRELKAAIAHGTITASIVIEGFSLDALQGTDRPCFLQRLETFVEMLRFD